MLNSLTLTNLCTEAAASYIAIVREQLHTVPGYKKFGTAIETVVRALKRTSYTVLPQGYTTTGESDDWMYSSRHIISMSPEARQAWKLPLFAQVGPERGGFWPPRSEIAGINSRNFDRTRHFEISLHECHCEVCGTEGWNGIKGGGSGDLSLEMSSGSVAGVPVSGGIPKGRTMARQFTRWPARKGLETQDSLHVLASILHRISNLGLSSSSGKAAQFRMRTRKALKCRCFERLCREWPKVLQVTPGCSCTRRGRLGEVKSCRMASPACLLR